MAVSALILAGGKATRMGGVAKHELVIDGRSIFERQVAVLASRVDEIIVSGAEVAGYRTVRDQLGSGPLAGIHAGLGALTADDCSPGSLRKNAKEKKRTLERPSVSSGFAVSRNENERPASERPANEQREDEHPADDRPTDDWLLVVAGDMPNITGELIDVLLAARGPELDAVAFRVDDRPEPLCSLLHVRTRAAVERRLVAGLYKASGLLTDEGLRVRWLTDADPEALRNLNSPSDLPE